MARYLESACKVCRRLGNKLVLKGDKCISEKCPVNRRPYIPGQHGPVKRRTKITDYGIHLLEKQKAKFYYCLMEKQFKKYFEEASRQRRIPTGERLIQLLEQRLDNIIYRSGLGISRNMSRQFVLHRKVFVNGKYVNIPSYQVKPSDVITLKEAFRDNIYIKSALEKKANLPSWIKFDSNKYEIEILKLPPREEIDVPFDEQLIVEFYSK
jgi:small subunit ribosomal protein S4